MRQKRAQTAAALYLSAQQLQKYVALVIQAGAEGISTRAVAQAMGVHETYAVHLLGTARQQGLVSMRRLHRAPSMWYATGVQPCEQAAALGTGRALTVKTQARLVLDHQQPTVVPPGVKVTRCPVRWA